MSLVPYIYPYAECDFEGNWDQLEAHSAATGHLLAKYIGDSHHPNIMVQCQTTRFFLDHPQRRSQDTWYCPYCRQQETYRLLDPTDSIASLINDAIEYAQIQFGIAPDNLETRVWLGNYPEAVFEQEQGCWHIYLSRDNNWLQYAYSGSHEACHRVWHPQRLNRRSWVDEMVAIHLSLRFLRFVGLYSHADRNKNMLERDALSLSQEALFRGLPPSGQYHSSVYGRSYQIGHELIEALGWTIFKNLAWGLNPANLADLSFAESFMTADEITETRIILAVESSST